MERAEFGRESTTQRFRVEGGERGAVQRAEVKDLRGESSVSV